MRGDFKVRWVPLIAVLFMLATGCSGDGARPETNSTTVDNSSAPVIERTFLDGPLDWYNAGLLEVPTVPASDSRATSGAQIVIYGDEYLFSYGTNNRPGESSPDGHIIAPGGDDDLLAWAFYHTTGLVYDRPVSLAIDVDSVIAPGGDDDLPLVYWVAVSDYTINTWQWHGPYSDDTEIQLNTPLICQRYVSPNYNLSYIVMTNCLGVPTTPGNPDGITSVEIAKSTVTTKPVFDPKYWFTRPIYTQITDLYTGTKSISALDPSSQYVTLTWEHFFDNGSSECEAHMYKVLRKHVDDQRPMLIGMLAAPGETFIDPVNAFKGSKPPEPGESYYYYLQPLNRRGNATMVMAGPITIPK
jgi:hypothetical protein